MMGGLLNTGNSKGRSILSLPPAIPPRKHHQVLSRTVSFGNNPVPSSLKKQTQNSNGSVRSSFTNDSGKHQNNRDRKLWLGQNHLWLLEEVSKLGLLLVVYVDVLHLLLLLGDPLVPSSCLPPIVTTQYYPYKKTPASLLKKGSQISKGLCPYASGGFFLPSLPKLSGSCWRLGPRE